MVEVLNTVKKTKAKPGVGTLPEGERPQSLYAARTKIFPKAVKGFFRTLKTRFAFIALLIYFGLPWIRWDRGPGLPDQAVLVDLQHRRFYFFTIEIWPQEFYYVAGLLILAGIGLFVVTSMFGRAWCGYGCWQTVWTDWFMWVDRKIEGDRNAQQKLDKMPWNWEKIRKRGLKYLIYTLIAFATALTFILYFADAPSLVYWFFTGQAPFVAYSTVAIMGFITWLFAGFMREQVCIYMCPWPRIQGAMVDEDTLIVTYHDWRGEPRGTRGDRKRHKEVQYGDCIDCGLCVAVCPTGIDIRDGQQLACITCALCIDACNGVMQKIGKPEGLISYSNVKTYNAHVTGKLKPEDQQSFGWRDFIRPRTIVYLVFWLAIGAAMFLHLTLRERLQINVVHDRNPIYTVLSNGEVRNGYTVRLLNMQLKPRVFRISMEGLEAGRMRILELNKPAARSFEVEVPANKAKTLKVYVTADPAKLKASRVEFRFRIDALATDSTPAETAYKRAVFEAPKK